jgi:hypothetical protein
MSVYSTFYSREGIETHDEHPGEAFLGELDLSLSVIDDDDLRVNAFTGSGREVELHFTREIALEVAAALTKWASR